MSNNSISKAVVSWRKIEEASRLISVEPQAAIIGTFKMPKSYFNAVLCVVKLFCVISLLDETNTSLIFCCVFVLSQVRCIKSLKIRIPKSTFSYFQIREVFIFLKTLLSKGNWALITL